MHNENMVLSLIIQKARYVVEKTGKGPFADFCITLISVPPSEEYNRPALSNVGFSFLPLSQRL